MCLEKLAVLQRHTRHAQGRSLDLLCNRAFDILAHIYFSCEGKGRERRKEDSSDRFLGGAVHNMLTAPSFGKREGVKVKDETFLKRQRGRIRRRFATALKISSSISVIGTRGLFQ